MIKIFIFALLSLISLNAYEELNIDNFDKKTKGKNAIIDFYASWCPPCKILAVNLEDFEIIKPDNVEIFKVNIEDELVLAKRYGVKKLPTLIYFKDGKPIKEYVGIKTPQELLESSKIDFK
ncbi:thioredoxin family protein [Aliarcobacter skirrowii]|uniref:thioredoxin family protein n=1 Tax=Aliarcobacter skirrowii TaxID=28200 RepID=UPI0029AB77A3|nr:thioredoxin family protein [Aliarcobacter skirrowii]MDX4057562.1 thioredoxin family protein [Aliarcobacter skirrowii]MDX4065695.1 thioredoxin family protein [Aliarcobacter skirrowii]